MRKMFSKKTTTTREYEDEDCTHEPTTSSEPISWLMEKVTSWQSKSQIGVEHEMKVLLALGKPLAVKTENCLEETTPNDVLTNDDTSHLVHNLLNIRIRTKGNIITVNQFIPKLENREAFLTGDIRAEILKAAENNTIINLDQELGDENPMHIPRKISNRVVVAPNIFRLHFPDIFVFKGLSRNELLQHIDSHQCVSSSDIINEDIANSRIILDDEDHWMDLTAIAEVPIHLVEKVSHQFILRQSTHVTSVLREHIMEKDTDCEISMSEDSLVTKLSLENETRIVCIADMPGAGKSWLLKSLAKKLQRNNPDFLVISLHMPNYVAQNPERETKDVFLSIFQHIFQSTLSASLLQLYVSSKQVKVFLFINGLQEIRHDMIDSALNTIQRLKEAISENGTIILSATPYIANCIHRSVSNVKIYDLLPFDKDDKVQTMVSHWQQQKHGTDGEQHLKDFATVCIQTEKQLGGFGFQSDIGSPMKFTILASLLDANAKNLLPDRPEQIENLQKIIGRHNQSVGDLFHNAMKRSVTRGASTLKISCEEMQSWYVYEAIRKICPDVLQQLKPPTAATSPENIEKAGIFLYTGTQGYFVHHTMAEYFTAHYFVQFWEKCSSEKVDTIESVGSNFLELLQAATFDEVLFTSDKDKVLVKKEAFRQHNILMFMNSIMKHRYSFKSNQDQLCELTMCKNALIHGVNEQSKSSPIRNLGQIKMNKYKIFQKKLLTCMYSAIICCIEAKFESLLCFLAQYFSVFIESNRKEVFITRVECFRDDDTPFSLSETKRNKFNACIVNLLTTIAVSGCTQMAKTVFQMFSEHDENYLESFCNQFPLEFLSPVEVSISRNDYNMVDFFLDKINISGERLLTSCLQNGHLTSGEIKLRVKIFERIKSHPKTPFYNMNLAELCNSIAQKAESKDINLFLVEYILPECDIPLRTFTSECKAALLNTALLKYDDKQLLHLLLLLFGKDNINNGTLSTVLPKSQQFSPYEPDNIINKLCIEEARETFTILKFQSDTCFQNLSTVDILKILIQICNDFSVSNKYERDYMHYAVRNGNIEWVEYLLMQNSESVKKPDIYGNTPIMCVKGKTMLAMTKLLIENGSDVLHVNKKGQNVAHILVQESNTGTLTTFLEWSLYMFHKGFHQLWTTRDDKENIPLDLLTNRYGSDFTILNYTSRLFLPVSNNEDSRIKSCKIL